MKSYAMLRHNQKPSLEGGAAFGVAYRELMPGLRDRWNTEAYDEDKRVNRKLYEKTAMELAASDQSQPMPPLRLRAVLTEVREYLTRVMEQVTGAIGLAKNNQPYDISDAREPWNTFVSKANPLLIGPVNVGMSDEDTNALHNLVTQTLLPGLEELQALTASKPRAWQEACEGEDLIMSPDIQRNILLQVRAKYYRAVPYDERRAGPAMEVPDVGPMGFDDEEPGPGAAVEGDVDVMMPLIANRQNRAALFDPIPRPPLQPAQQPDEPVQEEEEEEDLQAKQDLLTDIFNDVAVRQIQAYIGRYPNIPQEAIDQLGTYTDRIRNVFFRVGRQLTIDELVDVRRRANWQDYTDEIVIQGIINPLRNAFQNLEDRHGGEQYVIPRGESVAPQMTEAEVGQLLNDMVSQLEREGVRRQEIQRAQRVLRKFVQNWRKAREGRKRALYLANAQERLREIVELVDGLRNRSPAAARIVEDTTQQISRSMTPPRPSQAPVQEEWGQISPFSPPRQATQAIPQLQKPRTPALTRLGRDLFDLATGANLIQGRRPIGLSPSPVAVVPAPAGRPARQRKPAQVYSPAQVEAQQKKDAEELKRQKEEAARRRTEENVQKGQRKLANAQAIKQQVATKSITPPRPVAQATQPPAPADLPPGMEEWKEAMRRAVESGNKSQQARLRKEGLEKGYIRQGRGRYREINVPHTTKGKQGKGRWTDYSGPNPTAVMRSMAGAGAFRDTPMGQTNRQTRPLRDYDDLDYNDETNDVQEMGIGQGRSEMMSTENRLEHLNPDWKGLPRSLTAERKYPKLRKGHVNPKDKY